MQPVNSKKYQKFTGRFFYKPVPNPSTKPIMVGNIDLHLANGFLKIIFFSLWFFHFSKFWFSAGDKSVSLDDVIQNQWSDRITDHRIRRWLLVGWLTKPWSGFFQKTGENERFDPCSRIWDKAFGWSNENFLLPLLWFKLPWKWHWILISNHKKISKRDWSWYQWEIWKIKRTSKRPPSHWKRVQSSP